MATALNRRIVLKRRPVGAPRPDDFELVETELPRPGQGEILCRTIYLSLDPDMRGRIRGVRSYAKGVDPGELMVGGTVGEVVDSRHPGLAGGDLVAGYDGWQTHGVSTGAGGDVTGWVGEGRLRYREVVVAGLENAPAAFIGLLEGRNFGKLLVKVGEEPTP